MEVYMKRQVVLLAALITTGCVNASNHVRELHSTQEQEMTVGIVQKEIRRGMSQGDVALALGSPNIVSSDSAGKETWIYDKIATEASYSNSRGGLGGLGGILGAPGSVLLLGLGQGDYQKNAGASATTQKTLTVVIKFDDQDRVENATYHSSRF
jgi:outer membrane protein assembly factor BamE (lipoprotein component of BamABCDE complex)